MRQIGFVEALFRYPVKSMRGEQLDSAQLGWHGLEGDRRFALRRLDDPSGFPWLTASKLSELIVFSPLSRDGDVPTHIRTPDGRELSLFDEELAKDVERRCGTRVEMMHLRQGIFDDAHISLIAADTVNEIARLAGIVPDVRRFRPNVYVRATASTPFQEDGWVGGVIQFGEGDNAPAVTVTMCDPRCSMVNIDPDSGERSPEVLKAVVRVNDNNAGVYSTVTRTGKLEVGQPIFLKS